MKIRHKLLLAIALTGTTFSCDKDFLDQAPVDKFSETAVWNDAALVQTFVNNIYVGIPTAFQTIMLSNLVDEAQFNANWDTENVTKSLITPSNLLLFDNAASNGHERYMSWDYSYKNIRACNVYLEKIDAVPFDDPAAKDKLTGEVLFLRAYFYHQLLSLYGGVPLITKAYGLNEDYTITRDSYENCIKFITEECDKAAALLPATGDKARATKGAALALKSRVLLYAASDLYNSNADWAGGYGNKELVSFVGGDQQARWQAAKDAAKAVMDLNVYNLFGSENPATAEEATTNYSNIFLNNGNAEDIFMQFNDNLRNANWDAPNPGLFTGPNGWHTWGESSPIGQFVDRFEMKDGSKFDWNNPAHKVNPYQNRDPRLYASVLFEGAQWRPRPADVRAADPLGIVQVGNYKKPDGSVVPGLDTRKGPIEDWNGSYTGYYLRKFIDPTIDHQYVKQTYPFRRFRYAEILLNYAEACIELGQEEEAKTYINKVRARAGMPPVTETGQALVDRYRNERSVELGYEEHRYFDVRRWMIADQAYVNAEGVSVTGNMAADGTISNRAFSVVKIQDRAWNPRFYFLPIKLDEINRNNKLIQNPLY
ncbi:RagB/SusD family nutrient uptake outer membrane protein [Adhaeribacter radiodurans]|uniref:RagB/SusD family nutrient uptake outer membrane protein n=1 Tax=Adhaeribacter radiodurans TaxID=2745197 RepID=A0A7L7LA65_9BACT|nr:RagB/SusD family nutrient uptake outer membrane protein [Adhaeribacter radiodurans]QMU29627.1 RagB/SusD family nutrient uptake outer membrane protein [Adhaeribacter radiodurans]